MLEWIGCQISKGHDEELAYSGSEDKDKESICPRFGDEKVNESYDYTDHYIGNNIVDTVLSSNFFSSISLL